MLPAIEDQRQEYVQARPDVAMPFGAIEGRPVPSEGPLDAIYVPTLSDRPAPATAHERLKRHAHRIIYMFTDRSAPWARNAPVDSAITWTELPAAFPRERYESAPANRTRSARLAPRYDIPLKRSAAVAHAQAEGFGRIGLLDDDIELTDANLDAARAALEGGTDMASFYVLGYPDVSTVAHVERNLRRQPSSVSIGGNCLFLRLAAVEHDFPRLYNDDWFFLFRHVGSATIASVGVAGQRPYRAWEHPGRARFEQLGDVIVEGLRRRLSEGAPLDVTSEGFWEMQLSAYKNRVDGLLARSSGTRFAACLVESQQELETITVDEILEFVYDYFGGRTG
jgi:hypothetical protein